MNFACFSTEEDVVRNRAASHMQRLYRQRQSVRDKEEREMTKLPQPTVTKVFKGHRNSRTMVSVTTCARAVCVDL